MKILRIDFHILQCISAVFRRTNYVAWTGKVLQEFGPIIWIQKRKQSWPRWSQDALSTKALRSGALEEHAEVALREGELCLHSDFLSKAFQLQWPSGNRCQKARIYICVHHLRTIRKRLSPLEDPSFETSYWQRAIQLQMLILAVCVQCVYCFPTVMLGTMRLWGHWNKHNFIWLTKDTRFLKWLYHRFQERVTQSFWREISSGCSWAWWRAIYEKSEGSITTERQLVSRDPGDGRTTTNMSHAKS